jgi:hypothetical protein
MKLLHSRIFRKRGQKLLSNYYKQIEGEHFDQIEAEPIVKKAVGE